MKIEYEMADVKIVRYLTIAKALEVGFDRFKRSKALSKLVFHTLHLDTKTPKQLKAEQELQEMLAQPLGIWDEIEEYTRTLALITFSGEMKAKEFFERLEKSGYYPASVSEGMAYLPILAERGIVADTVFHLGTSFRDEKYMESRLLTRSNGEVEPISFFSATRLKQYYHIVVVKKEKENQKK